MANEEIRALQEGITQLAASFNALSTTISSAMSRMNTEIKGMSTAMAAANKTVAGNTAMLSANAGAASAAATAQAGLATSVTSGNAAQQASIKINREGLRQLRSIGMSYAGNAKNISIYKRNLTTMGGALKDTNVAGLVTVDTFQNMRKGILGVSQGFSQAQQSSIFLQTAKRQTEQLLTSVQNLGKNWQWAGRQLIVGLSLPIVGAATRSIQTYLSIEKEIVRLHRFIGPEFVKNEKDIRAGIEQIGHDFALNRKVVAAVQGDWAAMGYTSTTQLKNITTEVARMSMITGADLSDSTQGFKTFMATFEDVGARIGKSAEQTGRMVTDQFTAIEAAGTIDFGELLQAFPEVAAVANNFNLSAAQTASILSAMKARAIPASEAANALKFGLLKLQNPTSDAADLLKKYNIALFDMKGKARPGLEVLGEISTKMRGLSDQAKSELLTALFDKRQAARMSVALDEINKFYRDGVDLSSGVIKNNTEIGRTLTAAGETTVDVVNAGREAFLKMNDAQIQAFTTAAAEKEKAVKESDPFKWEQVRQDIQALVAEIGKQFFPIIEKVIKRVRSLLEAFVKLPAPVKNAIAGIALAMAALGPSIFIVGQLTLAAASFAKIAVGILPVKQAFEFVNDAMIEAAGGLDIFAAKAAAQGKSLAVIGDKIGLVKTDTKTLTGLTSLAALSHQANAAAIEEETAALVGLNAATTTRMQELTGLSVAEQLDLARREARKELNLSETGFLTPAQYAVVERNAKTKLARLARDMEEFGAKSTSGLPIIGEGAGELGINQNKKRGFRSAFREAKGAATVGSEKTAQDTKTGLAAVGATIFAFIKHPIQGLKSAFSTVGEFILGVFTKIKTAFTSIGSVIGEFAGKLAGAIQAAGGLSEFVGGIITGVVTSIAKFAALGAIIAGVVVLGKSLIEHFKKFSTSVSPGVKRLGDVFKDIWNIIVKVGEPVKRLIDTLSAPENASKMEEFWGKIGTAISNVIGWIANAIKFLLPAIRFIGSVFKGVADVVVDVILGIINFITGDWVEAFAYVGRAAVTLLSPVIWIFDKIVEVVATGMQGIASVIRGVVSALPDFLLPGNKKKQLAALDQVHNRIQAVKNMNFNKEIQNAFSAHINPFKKPIKDAADDAEDDAHDAGEKLGGAAGEGVGDGLSGELDDAFKDFLSEFKSQLDDQVDKIIKNALDSYDQYIDNVVQGYEDEINKIDEAAKARDRAFAEEEYQQKRRELLAKKELDNQNYLAARALAIYEGRTDDARMLDLQHVKDTEDANKDIASLEQDHQRDLQKQQEDAAKEFIKKAEDYNKAVLEGRKKTLEDDLNLLKQHTPRTAAEMQNLINTVQAKMTQYGATWKWGGETAATLFKNAVNDAKAKLEQDAFFQGKNTAAAYLAGLAGMNAFAPVEGPAGEDVAPPPSSSGNGGNAFVQKNIEIATGGITPDNLLTRTNIGGGAVMHEGGPVGSGIPQDVPATLQTGEFVINRKAAQKLGLAQLENLNKAGDGLGDATKRINDTTAFLMLAHLHNQIGKFTSGTATIGTKSISDFMPAMGGATGAGTGIQNLAAMLSKMFGLSITSMFRPGAITAHTGNVSLHALGRAVDLSGPRSAMKAAFDYVLKNTGSLGIQELIFEHLIWSASKGLHNWPWDDHMNHVHVGIKEAFAGLATGNSSLVGLLKQTGFSGEGLRMAYAIMMAESGGNPLARNVNSDGSIDRGLFQINNKWHPEVTDAMAYNAAMNAAAAFRISGAGSNWNAWSTFKNGSYKKFYNAALMMKGGIVPFDNFPALLHAKEMVLPAKISEKIVNGSAGGGGQTVIMVENFIGQRAWFEQLMKEYNIKIAQKSDRVYGNETRVISSYKDNTVRYRK